MEPVTVGVIGILAVFLLLALGMPIAFALMLAGFSGIALLSGVDAALPVSARTVYDEAATYPYMVIPLFIVMGSFAGASGMTKDIYGCLDKWLRILPGGLAVASIAACAAFAAVSGSAVATAATLGNIALPEMKKYNYRDNLATGAVAAGGTLGFLIPPSLGFVVYGMLTEQSIGKLLIAGMIPGIILAISFCATVIIWVRIKPETAPIQATTVSWKQRFVSLRGVLEPLGLFLLVMVGIYGGFFTPTEAGAVGATLLFFSVIIKKKLTWKKLIAALQEALRTSVMVLFLVAGASIFTYFLALSTIPMRAASWVTALDVSPSIILLAIIGVYLFLGCFLDAISMMVLTMPVVYPVMTALHYDPVWFGVVAVLMMQAGLITPPLGLNIFTIAGVAEDVKVEIIFRGVLPFLGAVFFVVTLLIFFPEIATYLPSKMSG
ncbi:TRAP transporter large permease [Desulforhopalus singaporensis]|uniref:TRAP transporter, DctM subunit n=1 Tax=Desulforhopalus singaporensis TaxID=91360 RepID=A0A1H0N5W8_9BACT|nr:TRAP transporter large permease [Desulforhopalus singaporensis]SDO88119.1 TRAP transporter, DctM subunit [Desulforhopalus singaporensis]